jgi:zinc transporter, ZIP family
MADAILFPFFLSLAAGLSTALGALAVFFIGKVKQSLLSTILGFSAGVMIFISFVEFLRGGIENIGFLYANTGFFLGIISIMALDYLIPHVYKGEKECKTGGKKLKNIGMYMALGIAIHNFPEGLAVSISSFSNAGTGILMAIAIALHNIPEGLSVAFPIFCETNDKRKAFTYALLSGLAEPVGALLGIVALYPFMTTFNLYFLLSMVAGVMVFISVDELLPACFREESSHQSIIGLFLGMLIMAASILLMGSL